MKITQKLCKIQMITSCWLDFLFHLHYSHLHLAYFWYQWVCIHRSSLIRKNLLLATFFFILWTIRFTNSSIFLYLPGKPLIKVIIIIKSVQWLPFADWALYFISTTFILDLPVTDEYSHTGYNRDEKELTPGYFLSLTSHSMNDLP